MAIKQLREAVGSASVSAALKLIFRPRLVVTRARERRHEHTWDEARAVAASLDPWAPTPKHKVPVQATLWSADIDIANRPRPWARWARAERVRAALTFYALDGTVVCEVEAGRWASKGQWARKSGEHPSDYEPMDFDARTTRTLNVAVRRHGAPECFALTNESWAAPGLCHPELRLAGNQWRVRIQLHGLGVLGWTRWVHVSLLPEGLRVEQKDGPL